MKLSKTMIDSVTYKGAGQDIRWDEDLSGFGLRIYPSGKKAFVLAYRFRGRFHIMTLGKYGELTPAQGRSLAKDKLASIRMGEDPLKKRRDEYHVWTIRQLGDEFLTRHAKHKKSFKSIERRVKKVILPRFGTHKVTEVTRSKISQMHDEIGSKHPYEANRILQIWSSMFERAKEWGRFPEELPNPAKRIKKKPERPRDRFVTADEMPRLMKAIDSEPSPYVRAAIKLYLLTGLRVSELLELQWSRVNLKEGTYYIPDTKADRPHYQPLSTQAIEILRNIPKQLRNPYVFCGALEGAHLVDLKKPWERILKAAKIVGLQKRDLRRTVGSWLVQHGHSLPLIGEVLNHSQPSTTKKTYAKFALGPVREALEEHAKRIAAHSS